MEEVAVDAERARIAQELHDVVGHEVTLIAIQAEAAASALRSAPERAAEPVEAIRATAHRTLAEIRGVLDLLAPDGRSGGTASDGLAETRPARRGGRCRQLARGRRSTLARQRTRRPRGQPDRPRVPDQRRSARPWAAGRAARQLVARPWSVCSTNPTRCLRHGIRPGRGLTGIRHRAELLGGTFEAVSARGSSA